MLRRICALSLLSLTACATRRPGPPPPASVQPAVAVTPAAKPTGLLDEDAARAGEGLRLDKGKMVRFEIGQDYGKYWPETPQPDPDVILPPAWAFGVIHGCYQNQTEALDRVQRLIREDYPIDALWIDSSFWNQSGGGRGYLDFEAKFGEFPEKEKFWAQLRDLHVKSGIWTWDRILDAEETHYQEFDRNGWLSDRIVGNGWHNPKAKHVGGRVDFENPAAVARWKELLLPLVLNGVDFFKVDSDPRPGYVRTHFELSQMSPRSKGRGFVLSHSRRLDDNIKKYPTAWSGDSRPLWKDDTYPDPKHPAVRGALRENISMVSNPRWPHYRLPFLTNDTGGFLAQTLPEEEHDELYMRWAQFSSVQPIMTVFGTKRKHVQNAPYTFSPAAQESFRKHTHLRMRLFPYLYSYAHLTRHESLKMIRGDGVNEYQFLVGRELLVAPVLAYQQRTREVHLPAGARWIDYWTRKSYEGGQKVTLDAPAERLPLLVRAGAILPMRDYARAIELGRNDPLTLDVYPSDEGGSFVLYEDDGQSRDYETGAFTKTGFQVQRAKGSVTFHISTAQGEHDGRLKERTYVVLLNDTPPPRQVRRNGKTARFSYDATTRTTTVKFRSATNEPSTLVLN